MIMKKILFVLLLILLLVVVSSCEKSTPFDYEEEYIYKTETGLYLIDMPHKDKMIIKTNKDRTKAIILYNSFVFGRHKEFNIVETEKRLVLWYKDEDIYCGYIYDKRYKVCKYFEENDFFATF